MPCVVCYDQESPFLKATPYSLNNLSLKKQIADLQIIDYICGNPDRHGGNIFYRYQQKEDGTTQLTGIQGIDNDLSFGTISIKTGKRNVSDPGPYLLFTKGGICDKIKCRTMVVQRSV